MMTQEKLPKYEGKDRRWFTRFRANFPVRIKDLEDGIEREVDLKDVSARGVGILSEGKIALDKKVETILFIPDHHESLNVRGQVIWLRPTEQGRYRLGIKFERINLIGLSRIFRLTGE